MHLEKRKTDVLVIGGGIAGLFAAIAARQEGAEVILISKSTAGRGGESVMAAGVYLGFEPEEDNLEEWVKESLDISDGLDDPLVVGRCILVSHYLRYLMDAWGVEWEKSGGKFVTKPGLGMRKMRNAMFHDGRQLMWVLRGKAAELGTEITDRLVAVDLLTSDGQAPTSGSVCGAVCFHVRRDEVQVIQAGAVVLATGPWGINQFHPMDVTGDGQAMALRVGARLRSMEQLCFSLAPRVGLSLPGMHALTGHGGKLINAHGERYMERYSPELLERSPRPVLVQAAAKEISAGRGPLYLDLRHLSAEDHTRLERVVPHTFKALRAAGLDPREQLIEYVPTLYGNGPMGGVMIDENCATNIPGLYCAGGCSDRMYAGVPGLTGASATGYLAGRQAARFSRGGTPGEPVQDQIQTILDLVAGRTRDNGGAITPRELFYAAQKVVLDKIGILKEPRRLYQALEELEELTGRFVELKIRDRHELMNALEVRNIIEVAKVVARASLERTESRYFHHRVDYPARDDARWSRWLICRLKGPDELEFSTVPFRGVAEALPVLLAEDWGKELAQARN